MFWQIFPLCYLIVYPLFFSFLFSTGKKRATKAAHSQLDDSALHHSLIPQNSADYGMMLADLQNHEGSGGAQMHGQK